MPPPTGWRAWFRRDDDVDEELRTHLRMAVEERVARGETPEQAEHNARREFGNVTHVSEVTREVRPGWVRLLDELALDVRYALRQLRASPGFAAAVLVTLSLGIGVTTILYSLNATVMSRPVAFRDIDRLVHVAQGTGGCNACFRMAQGNYLTVRNDARSLAGVTLVASWGPILRGPERTEVIRGALVTPSLFPTFGIQAMLGRTLVPADTLAGEQPVVVLNETLWRTQFGADSAIVGRTIVVDAAPRVVVGVIPAALAFPHSAMMWGVRLFGAADAADRSWTNDDVVARLQPGVTLEEARAELAALGARVAADFPETMRGWTFDAMPFAEWARPRGGDQFLTIGSAVALVLLVACINLAGLLVARLTARRKEIAVRAAMGAGAGRIARQLLTETILIAIVSGVVGALFAAVAIDAISASLPSFITTTIPNWSALRVEFKALGFAIGTAVITGAAIGLWPAIRFARPSLVGELKDGARNASAAAGVSRFRRGLVVAEVAFAIVLLAGAALLARSLAHLHAIHPGFRTDHLLTLRVVAPPRAPADTGRPDSARYERLAQHLERVPGVIRAAAVLGLPFSHSASTSGFEIETGQSSPNIRGPSVRMLAATSGYFGTLEIPILRGRAFDQDDRAGAPHVVIISGTIAERFFRDGDPMGAHLIIGEQRWRIVGVAGNAYYGATNLTRQHPGEIYRPMSQWPFRSVQFAIRSIDEPADLTHAVERAVREFNPDLAVRQPMSMEALMSDDLAVSRLMTTMMAGFALAAMLISVIGLYGVISYSVAQRTREFGIRRALGAGTGTLIALVVGQGARLTVIGAAVGLAGALAATRAMRAILVGVSPGDPVTLLAVAGLMCIVGLGAAYLPARRASRVDPMISLREE